MSGKLELIQSLFAYNEWANGVLLNAATSVDEPLLSVERTGYGSVLATLGHIRGAQATWLNRWVHGGNPPEQLPAVTNGGLEDVRKAFDASHTALREYLDGLTEPDTERVLSYRNSRGDAFSDRMWQLLVHVSNHGTFHRGEIAAALTAMGHSPGEMDFAYWLRKRGASE